MNKHTFISQFKEQFIDADEISIDGETQFRQLPTWDSLTGMSVLVMIQDEYGVEMKDKDLKACNTVEDIYNFVSLQKQGQA
jgi:acyl carrier protein